MPAPANQYEVKTILTLAASGGTYVHYLRATANAMSGPAAQGTYYAVELQDPTFTGNTCSATLVLYKCAGGTLTQLSSKTVACKNGMVMRSIYASTRISVHLDGVWAFSVLNDSIAGGQPGIGARATPAAVDLQWQGAVDDANGIGQWRYRIKRGGVVLAQVTTPEFTDASVAAATTYSYTLETMDYHWNYAAAATITVNTPPAGSVDARHIGVRTSGAYWGAMGDHELCRRRGRLFVRLQPGVVVLAVLAAGGLRNDDDAGECHRDDTEPDTHVRLWGEQRRRADPGQLPLPGKPAMDTS